MNTIRDDFPILSRTVNGHKMIWADSGATTQKPNSVIDSIVNFYVKDNSNIHRSSHTLARHMNQSINGVRKNVANFIGANASEIVFTRGTTQGINMVISCFASGLLSPGDSVILSVAEHHSVVIPWVNLAKIIGFTIRCIPLTPDGDIDMRAYNDLFDSTTKFVSCVHMSNVIGRINNVEKICLIARERGCWTLIDGAQAVQHTDVDMSKIGCDFYAFSGHKMFGPTGVGVLYCRGELGNEMCPLESGGGMSNHVTFDDVCMKDFPHKLEAGTLPLCEIIALGEAIRYLTSLDRKFLIAHEVKITKILLDGLPYELEAISSPDSVGIISLVSDTLDLDDLAEYLDSRGVQVRVGHQCAIPLHTYFGRERSLRISLALYNLEDEVHIICELLHKYTQ